MKSIIYFFVILLFISCQPQSNSNVEDLFEVDKKFSTTADEIGFNKAFIEYAHTDGVLLRENSMPVAGKTNIAKIFKDTSTKGINLTWEPLAGDIAKSGELGYTYGIFTMKMDTVVEKGTYVSIWKKDKAGNWKYVLDTGNKGLGE